MSQGNSPISQSPSTSTIAVGHKLHELVRSGKSFSGRERNCCFANLGLPRFANTSAVSGLDFPDDSRGAAIVDWDADGDLDVWLSNRSGPQVRFLQNDVPSDYHFVSLRLVGTKCNRDAIGARVEVELAGRPAQRLIRTLRAGDAYLSQSSKWIHLGLGRASTIRRVNVRWPGGDLERFSGARPDGRYKLVQGTGQAKPLPVGQRRVKLRPSKLEGLPTTDQARVVLAARTPMPTLSAKTYDGKQLSLEQFQGQPVLVVFWASWCAPCILELKAITEHQQSLRAHGVEVLTLCVDELDTDARAEAGAGQQVMDELGFPFHHGCATDEAIEKIALLRDVLFDQRSSPVVPSSYLLDPKGQLAVIYRGPISIEFLLEDASNLGASLGQRRQWSVPFDGKWFTRPTELNLRYVASTFHDRYPLEEIRFLQRAAEQLRSDRSQSDLHASVRRRLEIDLYRTHRRLVTLWSDQQNLERAIQSARSALAIAPSSASMQLILAELLVKQGRGNEAAAALRKAEQLARRAGNNKLAEQIEAKLHAVSDHSSDSK